MDKQYYDYIAGTYLPGQWQRIAKEVRRRDRFRCQRCRARGWHVHHRHYRHLFREQDCGYCCLTTLCEDCHKAEHGRNRAPTDEELAAMIRSLLYW
jgi:5-methylcytosine-specific restriction endonuclease McrA